MESAGYWLSSQDGERPKRSVASAIDGPTAEEEEELLNDPALLRFRSAS